MSECLAVHWMGLDHENRRMTAPLAVTVMVLFHEEESSWRSVALMQTFALHPISL